MTYDFYKAKRNNISIQIGELYGERSLIEFQYIEERRLINKGANVVFEDKMYWFNGTCEIDHEGNLRYELECKSGYSVFKLFDEFEVVE